MCSFITYPDQQPSAYIAKRDFEDKGKKIKAKKGEFISVAEYERLLFDEQDSFEPSFDGGKPKGK
jgi:hypothetical protein